MSIDTAVAKDKPGGTEQEAALQYFVAVILGVIVCCLATVVFLGYVEYTVPKQQAESSTPNQHLHRRQQQGRSPSTAAAAGQPTDTDAISSSFDEDMSAVLANAPLETVQNAELLLSYSNWSMDELLAQEISASRGESHQ